MQFIWVHMGVISSLPVVLLSAPGYGDTIVSQPQWLSDNFSFVWKETRVILQADDGCCIGNKLLMADRCCI